MRADNICCECVKPPASRARSTDASDRQFQESAPTTSVTTSVTFIPTVRRPRQSAPSESRSRPRCPTGRDAMRSRSPPLLSERNNALIGDNISSWQPHRFATPRGRAPALQPTPLAPPRPARPTPNCLGLTRNHVSHRTAIDGRHEGLPFDNPAHRRRILDTVVANVGPPERGG